MYTYFPAIKPYTKHMLAVSGGHKIYVEESGIPHGIPAIYVHGGPGAGSSEDYRRLFDPNVYRIVLFDQRGCGHSTPHAELENNTTPDLLADMEAIRQHLNIDKWLIVGGSWGTTVALLYAEQYPQHVKGLILRGIFLARPDDIHWLYRKGTNQIFPDYWDDFVNPLSAAERNDIVKAYHKRLTGHDELARMSAAKAFAQYEARCMTLNPEPQIVEKMSEPVMAYGFARIACHYFYNHCFMESNQILNNIDKIQDIPGIIVHGRYDLICAMENAWGLHKAWPKSQLNIIRDAGHASSEPGILDGLIHAIKLFAHREPAA